MTGLGWSRRAVLAGAAATAGAVGAGSAAGAAGSTGHGLADAVLAAFRRHRIVAVGEVHGQQEHHDALLTLLLDPRLPGVVDDIVVEFGNALYQPTIDRFVAGPAVEDRDLRLVWRNTTQSPVATWDAPMYEQFYRAVRAANWPLPAAGRMRVLLGDPPLDWSTVKTVDDVASLDRDGHLASVVRRQVLDRGRRALICYGSNHVKHAPPGAHGGGGLAQLEQQTGERAYVILSGGHPRLAGTPRRRVLAAAGSWLATADTSEFTYFSGDCGITFGAVADALLYLGEVADQTQSLWNPAIYLDPAYWAELQRRQAITGAPVDLDAQYRQEQPVAWPAPPPATC
jgi:heme-binding uptake protein ChaN (Tiki superfamily)